MKKVNEELYMKELNKLKNENLKLQQQLISLNQENSELKKKVLSLTENHIISEPLELSFEEKSNNMNINLESDMKTNENSVKDDIEDLPKLQSTVEVISLTEFDTLGKNSQEIQRKEETESDINECIIDSIEVPIPEPIKLERDNSMESISVVEREIFKDEERSSSPKSYKNNSKIINEKTKLDKVKNTIKTNTNTPRAEKLIAALMIPVKPMMLTKLQRNRNISPITTKSTNNKKNVMKSPIKQLISGNATTKKKSISPNTKFTTPHFN